MARLDEEVEDLRALAAADEIDKMRRDDAMNEDNMISPMRPEIEMRPRAG